MCRVTMGHLRLTVVTICHLKANIDYLMATLGHLMATISQPRATIDHFRVTIGYLRATIGHMLVNIGHLTVSFLFFFQANLRQNATELSSGEGQARIGKGWQSRRKASKLKPEPRAYTIFG